jgi:hypothetical protein
MKSKVSILFYAKRAKANIDCTQNFRQIYN